VGSALLLPTVVLVGLLAAHVMRATVPGAADGGLTFLPGVTLSPEPGEQRAYIVLLLAPLLLSAGLIATFHKGGRLLRSSGTKYWVLPAAVAGQVLVLSLIVVSLRRQQALYPYFHVWQLAISAVATVLVAVAVAVPRALAFLHRRPCRRSWPATTGSSRRSAPLKSIWFAVALLTTFAFLSTTIYTDGNIALAPMVTWWHVPFTSEEFSAVLDGLTPLVDFTPQYTVLLPYLAAPVFTVTGLTIGSFTTVMALISATGLLSVFVALVRVTGRGSLAALLYLPFLALTFYPTARGGAQVQTMGAYYAVLPLRYAFPLLLTSLIVAYAVSAHRWRSALLLGGVAGAGLVNNVDFGIAALGAVLVSVFVAEAARRDAAGRWRATAAA